MVAQSEYDFTNALLKEIQKDYYGFDSLHFITDFDISSPYLNKKKKSNKYQKDFFQEKFQDIVDSCEEIKDKKIRRLKLKDLNIIWEKNRIDHFKFAKHPEKGFSFIMLSKPFYLSDNYVIIISYTGAIGTSTQKDVCVIKWNKAENSVRIIACKWYYISGPNVGR